MRDKLLKLGTVYVMRAASSKGAADLIALWPAAIACVMSHDDLTEPVPVEKIHWRGGPVWVVQCKRDGRLPKDEREALIEIHIDTGAVPVLAKAGKNGRGVVFIDLLTGDELGIQ